MYLIILNFPTLIDCYYFYTDVNMSTNEDMHIRGMRKGSLSSVGSRRHRNIDWYQQQGYSSSEEEIPPRPVDSHVFASLLSEAEQEYNSKLLHFFM